MPESMSNVQLWQVVLLFAGGLVVGFFSFLILYKEKLAALQEMERRELERDQIFEEVRSRAEAHAETVKRFMEGRI